MHGIVRGVTAFAFPVGGPQLDVAAIGKESLDHPFEKITGGDPVGLGAPFAIDQQLAVNVRAQIQPLFPEGDAGIPVVLGGHAEQLEALVARVQDQIAREQVGHAGFE